MVKKLNRKRHEVRKIKRKKKKGDNIIIKNRIKDLAVRNAWDEKKSVKANFKQLGLSVTPNVAITGINAGPKNAPLEKRRTDDSAFEEDSSTDPRKRVELSSLFKLKSKAQLGPP